MIFPRLFPKLFSAAALPPVLLCQLRAELSLSNGGGDAKPSCDPNRWLRCSCCSGGGGDGEILRLLLHGAGLRPYGAVGDAFLLLEGASCWGPKKGCLVGAFSRFRGVGVTPNWADGCRRGPPRAAVPVLLVGILCWRPERVDSAGDGGARTVGGSARTQRKRWVGHLSFWHAALQVGKKKATGEYEGRVEVEGKQYLSEACVIALDIQKSIIKLAHGEEGNIRQHSLTDTKQEKSIVWGQRGSIL